MDTVVTLFKGFVYLIGFGSILFLTYITTKFIGARASKVTKGKYISTIDTVAIGLNKQLHLIKVGEQFVLIASSGKNIEFLTNVDLDNFETEKKEINNGSFDFKNIFEKYFQTVKNKKNVIDLNGNEGESNRNLTPSIGNSFKKNLSKLRAITSKVGKSVNENGDEKADDK